MAASNSVIPAKGEVDFGGNFWDDVLPSITNVFTGVYTTVSGQPQTGVPTPMPPVEEKPDGFLGMDTTTLLIGGAVLAGVVIVFMMVRD